MGLVRLRKLLDRQKLPFVMGKTLGEGSFGVVKKAERAGKVAAVKILQKDVLGRTETIFANEIDILKQLSHQNIIAFVCEFETKHQYYIATEFAAGGTLSDKIVQEGKFTELSRLFNYLHKNNIVHGDLKPENVLYVSQEMNSRLVVAGFGAAERLQCPNRLLTTIMGTPIYQAPEIILHHSLGKQVDIWSLGVITYLLLCGYTPCKAVDLRGLEEEMRDWKCTFHGLYWTGVSENAKVFVKQLLQAQPEVRLLSTEVFQHIWLNLATGESHS